MNTKVSVIIAAYNIENYILKCVESVINQTLKDIEIIIVNDGSTDNTLNIIKNIAKKDDRIKIIDKKNEGLIEARKSGLNKAKGKYILFIDGDDWIELNTLEKLYNNAIDNNSDIVIYNSYIAYDDKKIEIDTFKNIKEEDYIKNLFLDEIYPGLVFKMIKKEFLKDRNIELPSNLSFGEDLATTASLFIEKPRISYVEDYLYNYYKRSDSISNTINLKVLELIKVIEFIKRKLKENNLYNKYKEEYEYMVYRHIIEHQLLTKYYSNKELGSTLQNQYKSYNINIMSNKYIKTNILKYPLSQQIRTISYCKSYNLGRAYDKIRSIKKG